MRFKGASPSKNSLEEDIMEGKLRCDAIVTTGKGTGVEAPTKKLEEFKKYMNNFPLIVGTGLNNLNAYKQLKIADGAIVGSYFKSKQNTILPVDRHKVRDLMSIVKEIRKNKK